MEYQIKVTVFQCLFKKAPKIEALSASSEGACAMLSCHQVANYFLTKVNTGEGEVITNLKLQKLAYYVQSASLAFFEVSLFAENLEAWKHGPVVPELYQAFKKHGPNSLPRARNVSADCYNLQDRKLMDDVYAFFGQFAAWKLRDMTHEETPWREAYPAQGIISPVSMRDYFREHWGDQLRAAAGDPAGLPAALLSARWTPSPDSLAAAHRYKQGRVEGDKYTSEAF